MSEQKQLTPDELQSIKDLQQRYNQTVFELGSVEAQIIGSAPTNKCRFSEIFADVNIVIYSER